MDDDRELTDEAKFDLEYGGFNPEPSQIQQNVPAHAINKRESQYDYTRMVATHSGEMITR